MAAADSVSNTRGHRQKASISGSSIVVPALLPEAIFRHP
jgi:hypothetical protein